jgi:hypothetical protein
MEFSDKVFENKINFRNRPRRRVNWREAAEMLAGGISLEAAAERLGCGVPVLRRNLRRSSQFRLRIQQAAEQRRLRAQLRFMALGEHVAGQLRMSDKLDLRILQWLAVQVGMDKSGRLQDSDIAARWELALGLTSGKRLSAEEMNARQAAGLQEMLAEIRSYREPDYKPPGS